MEEAMSGALAAREAARKGRHEQLRTYEDFEAGKQVVFRVHNNPAGYKLCKKDLKKPANKGPAIRFADGECLLDAASNSDLAEVQALLAKGVKPNVCDADGLTPLHRACTESALNLVGALVTAGANINAQDNEGWTPLHTAAAAGHWRIVNYLISGGADALKVNCEGDLPIDVVADAKTESIIQAEMERLGVKTEAAMDAVREKRQQELIKAIEALIAKDGDINAPIDSRGGTLLHVAASNGYLQALDLVLAQRGLKLNPADWEGNTPLHLAVHFQEYDAVVRLLAKGASVTARNLYNQKPIVLSEDETMIQLLAAVDKEEAKFNAHHGKGKRATATGTINRSARAKKRSSAVHDVRNENSVLTAESK